MRLGDYNVMRYAVVIGYSNGKRIISVATRRPTLALALEAAHAYKRGQPDAFFWIARVRQQAHLRTKDR